MSNSENNGTPRRTFLAGLTAAFVPVFVSFRAFSQTVSPSGSKLGVLSTVLGGGPVGNALATVAAISTPFALCCDGSNNLYISDNYYHRIYRVAAHTGLLTTVAGSGIPGYSGDGGPAVDATLFYPYGISCDAAGNLSIADTDSNRIRYVNSASGIISTVAGTGTPGYNGDGIAAISAQLNTPQGTATDSAGNLYVADSDNSRIRLVNQGQQPITIFGQSASPITVLPGQIQTVAGNGKAGYSGDGHLATAARLNLPWGVALDSFGNILIADYYNQRLRSVDINTGVITTLAGTGHRGAQGDGGPAVDASLTFPCTLALDSAGNIYIGQEQTSMVRKITVATGIITTVAGTHVLGTGGDGGPATKAELNSPTGVAIDSTGALFIAEYGGARVRRVDRATQIIETFAGSTNFGDGGQALQALLNEPVSVSFDAQGRLTVSDQANQQIRTVNADGTVIGVAGTGLSGYNGDGIPATTAQLNVPSDAQFDPGGNLFICDRGNGRIRRVDAVTGIITTVAGNGGFIDSGDGGPATQASLNQARAILLDPNGNLWIAELDGFRIRFVNLSAQTITLYPDGPAPIVVAPGYIVTAGGNGTSGSDGDGGPAQNAQINSPRGVTMDSSMNIYATEGGRDPQNLPGPGVKPDSKVRKIIYSTGIISTVAGTETAGYNGDGIPATQAELNGPRNVTVDAAGNVYIADSLNNRIRKVDAQTGLISTICGSFHVGFSGDGGPAANGLICTPRYVGQDASGNLLFADVGNSRIRKITFA